MSVLVPVQGLTGKVDKKTFLYYSCENLVFERFTECIFITSLKTICCTYLCIGNSKLRFFLACIWAGTFLIKENQINI